MSVLWLGYKVLKLGYYWVLLVFSKEIWGILGGLLGLVGFFGGDCLGGYLEFGGIIWEEGIGGVL